ncbi:hypothetical protein GE09DRAFT_1215239 [Coniochaeta sp. 2T2.1]|nr:hypothetical protein GE09DRAFT_1215239 [Coniochaeta sp. 2T2.1]
MSSSPRDNYSTFSMSPSPPTDLGSYSRFMHQHTKRQMDSINRTTQRLSNHHQSSSSSSSRNSNNNNNNTTSSMPNGVANIEDK